MQARGLLAGLGADPSASTRVGLPLVNTTSPPIVTWRGMIPGVKAMSRGPSGRRTMSTASSRASGTRSQPASSHDQALSGPQVTSTDEIFLTAGYTDISADIGGYNISEQDLALSVGYAYPVAANTDVIGRVGYVRAELDAEDLGDDSDDGYSLGVGVRTRPLDPIELEANVMYVDLGRGRHDQFRHRRVLVLHAAGGLRRDWRVQRRRGELQHRLPRHAGRNARRD